MAIYSVETLLKMAVNSRDFIRAANGFITAQQDIKLGEKLYLTALEKGKCFYDFEEISRGILHLELNNYTFSWMNSVKECCIHKIERIITEILRKENIQDKYFLDGAEFLPSAVHLHKIGSEQLTIQLFRIGCFMVDRKSICDLLEYAIVVHELEWDKKQTEAIQLLTKLKSVTAQYQDNQSTLPAKENEPYDYCDLKEAACNASKLDWIQIARKLYEKCMATIPEYENECAELVSIAVEVAKTELLNDLAWSVEIFKRAIELTKNKEDYILILSNLGKLKDSSYEEQLISFFIKKYDKLFLDRDCLLEAAMSLSDSPFRETLLIRGANLTLSTKQAFGLIDCINGNPSYKQLLHSLNDKVKFQQDYLFELLERFVYDNKGTPENFQNALNEKNINTRRSYQYDRDGNNTSHWTLLMRSCFLGRNDIARILIDKGANMSITNELGYNALIASLSNLEVKNDSGGQEIKKEIIFSIMKSGIDINGTFIHTDGNITSAFVEASCNGYLDVIKELYDMGANYQINGDKGRTVLMAASYTCRIDVLNFLLELGADAASIDNFPAFWEYNKYEDEQKVIEILKNAGANLN
ncbi:MAG: ankyrin repeat domain-containing protein [Saprospiraceae bacterium]